jgi:hypothetical protein
LAAQFLHNARNRACRNEIEFPNILRLPREDRSMKNNSARSDEERYIDSMHRLGRIGMIGAILLLLGMPTAIGLHFNSLSSIRQVIQAALPLLMIFVPSTLFEVLTYTPLLGSAVYLTLITGEVINLKLPVASNAMKILNIEPGTDGADAICSIAVSIASFVTIAIVTAGVALAVPLQPLLAAPAISAAASNILPALFGALAANALDSDLGGGISARGRFKGLLPCAAALLLLSVFDRQISGFLHLDELAGQDGKGVIMSGFQGFVVIAMLPVSYFSTKWLYAKKRIEVRLPEDR